MATWTFVDFNVPEAQRLADLTGVQYDLENVEKMCLLIEAHREPQSAAEWQMVGALCASAIVSYGRTLTTGVRSGITRDQIDQLSPVMQAAHVYFKDLRDKWIAHSVNAYEDNHVVAYLVPEERGPKEVCGVSVQHTRVALLSSEDIANLRVLANDLMRIVRKEIVDETKKVLTFAKSLPVEPFYTAPSSAPRMARKSEVGKPRRKIGES